MIAALEFANYAFFFYYLAANLFYLALLLRALHDNHTHRRRLASLRLESLDDSPFTAPVSLIVPAYNEEETIVESVTALLQIDYPELEIIIVNDGSRDATLEKLSAYFDLREVSRLYVARIACRPVRRIFSSGVDSRMLVLDKENGGTKADAVNAGINAARSPYLCVIDADSLLEPDAIRRIMAESYSDEVPLVASGGIVRVLNGSRGRGKEFEARVPRGVLEAAQVVEYLRSFLIGRAGWTSGNMLSIISGAFGVFSRELVMQIGGYRNGSIGEDFDLVVRLHRRLLEIGKSYRIRFVPEPTCWTQVPADFRSLARQRARWQNGLFDVLWRNREIVFRPRYGRCGSVMLPFLWVFELAAPVIEVLGYTAIVVAESVGALRPLFFLEFLLFGYAFSTMISIGSVLLEEVTYRRYARASDVARLIGFCFIEHFPYRQLNMVWRLMGMWHFLRGKKTWHPIRRQAMASAR